MKSFDIAGLQVRHARVRVKLDVGNSKKRSEGKHFYCNTKNNTEPLLRCSILCSMLLVFNTDKCGSTQRSTYLCRYLCNLFFERNVHTKYNA